MYMSVWRQCQSRRDVHVCLASVSVQTGCTCLMSGRPVQTRCIYLPDASGNTVVGYIPSRCQLQYGGGVYTFLMSFAVWWRCIYLPDVSCSTVEAYNHTFRMSVAVWWRCIYLPDVSCSMVEAYISD